MNNEDWEKILQITNVRNFVQLKSGKLVEIMRGEDDIKKFLEGQKQVTLHALDPGCIAGNHYHLEKEERTYIASGRLLVALEDINSKEKYEKEILEGYSFFFPAGIAHAIQNITNSPAFFLYTSTSAFSPENPKADLFPYEVIKPKEKQGDELSERSDLELTRQIKAKFRNPASPDYRHYH